MPNWCDNEITLTNKEVVEKIDKWSKEKGEKSIGLFSLFYPMPEELKKGEVSDTKISELERETLKDKYGADNWYDWHYDNWGTKWDVFDCACDRNGDTISLSFDTAWCPPKNFYSRLSQDYDIQFEANFREEAGFSAGYYVFTKELGTVEDEVDPDGVSQLVLEEYLSLNLPETDWDTFMRNCELLYIKRETEMSKYLCWFDIFNRMEEDFDQEELKKYKITPTKRTEV